MSTISAVSQTGTTTNTSAGSSQALDRDAFLQLLVTKLQNQDPLNPTDDADFIAQLAQFSTLEQMNNIAEGIESSNQWDYLQMQSLNNTMAAGLIGKDVKASYDGVYVESGDSSAISFTLDEGVTEMEFTVRDAEGTVVATLTEENLAAGVHSITWDGTDTVGNRVADGYYTVEASGTNAAGNAVEPELSVVGRVESVIYRDGSAYLRVAGLEIPLSDVTAIGEEGVFTEDEG